MVQITQTDEEIKIIIELNRLITRKPDIVLLPNYIKFNNPPIFFERHLTQDIDEISSFCRIFKKEARIVLIKKQKGIWPEIFKKLTKEELQQKRLEISDQIIERNKERDQQALERYEQKRRAEIEKEVRRETAMRERVKNFEDKACRDALMVGTRKETHTKVKLETRTNDNRLNKTINNNSSGAANERCGTPATRSIAVPPLRSAGKINVDFSNYDMYTPKRESQEGISMPFKIIDKDKNEVETENKSTNLETLDE